MLLWENLVPYNWQIHRYSMQLTECNQDQKGIEKVWLNSYERGVPAEINPDAYSSLVEILKLSCQQYGTRDAFYNMGVTITYNELESYVKQVAAYLQQELGLQKGDRLAIMLPNVLQYPIVMFAALYAGLIVVNVNPLYTAAELEFQLNDSGALAIITLENFAATVQKALPYTKSLKHIIVCQITDFFLPYKAFFVNLLLKYFHKKFSTWEIKQAIPFKKILKSEYRLNPVAIDSTDIAFLQYTGGTTGISKGAILTHRNLVANLQQAEAWFKNLLRNKSEIIVTALPLYHIFSLTANCLFFSKLGGLNVLITNPRDIKAMVKEIKKFPFTAITGVNTLYNALLKNPQFAKINFSHLRLSLGGGMAVQKVVAEKWQQITGVPLLEAYGLTETSPCATINPAHTTNYNGTIGLPVCSTLVCLLDEAQHPVAIGEPGEIAIKGPQVMQGYWQNSTETAKVFTKDHWLLTGDMGVMDEHGYIKLLERKKDVILISGFNVYPNEIEDVLAQYPGVVEVAVIGIPDEHSGEAIKAFIVPAQELNSAKIKAYCRKHLTSYKIPKYIEFCTDLPKTNVGKILRRALRK